LLLRGGHERGWTLRRGQEAERAVAVNARLLSDDWETLKSAAMAGMGIVAMPGYLCRAEVEEGALTCVLPEWAAGQGRITMLVPSRRGQLPSVRAFMDFLIAEFPAAMGSRTPSVPQTPVLRSAHVRKARNA
jgi:DNA-binding transcriptional LysR family regulator